MWTNVGEISGTCTWGGGEGNWRCGGWAVDQIMACLIQFIAKSLCVMNTKCALPAQGPPVIFGAFLYERKLIYSLLVD